MTKHLTILDLDRTAFDTDRFIGDIDRVLEKKFQLKASQLVDGIADFKAAGELGYDFFAHAKWLTGADTDTISQLIVNELGGNDYLFADVEPWLKQQSEPVIIVTVGHVDFQQFKVNCTPKLAGMPVRIVGEDKGIVLKRQLRHDEGGYYTGWTDAEAYKTITIIDDNPATFEALGADSPVHQIRMARPNQRYSNQPGLSHPRTIASLKELM